MADIGPVTWTSGATLKGVLIRNGKVRNVVAGTWVDITSGVFANCLFALTELSTTGVYYADFPSGVLPNAVYGLVVYQNGATDFDSDLRIAEPFRVDPVGATATTSLYGGDLASAVVTRAAYEVHDEAYAQASQSKFLEWLSEAQQDAVSRAPWLALESSGNDIYGAPFALTLDSTLLVPSTKTAALIKFVTSRWKSNVNADMANVSSAKQDFEDYLRLLGVA